MTSTALSFSPAAVEAPRPPKADINRVFGLVRGARTDPLHFFLRVARDRDVVELPNPFGPFFLVNHPDHVERILQSNWRNYPKSDYHQRVKPLFGDGVFIMEGEAWKQKRQTIQPAFRKAAVEGLAGVVVEEMQRALDDLAVHAGTGEEIDITVPLTQTAFQIITRALCSEPIPGDQDEFSDAVVTLMRAGEKVLWSLFPFMHSLPTPGRFKIDRAIKVVDENMFELVRRRLDGEPKGDMLDLLLAYRTDGGERLSLRTLRDDLVTMLVAGHETTALAMSWTLYEMSRSPQLTKRLRDDVRAAIGDRAPTLEDLPKLAFVEQTVKEALRLYPPFWSLSRKAVEADRLGDYRIPANATLMLCPYVMHRNPAYWDNPEAFDPDRWGPDRIGAIHEHAYFPFGGGPRTCIGKRLASMEAVLSLAMIVQRFDLHLATGQKVEPEPMISFRPRHGIRMTVHDVVT